MKIRVAANTNTTYIGSLVLAYQEGGLSTLTGTRGFWDGPDGKTEVLHIHWPEALLDWRTPDTGQLDALRSVLRAWRERVPIICTVHNEHPHYRDSAEFRTLYETTYEHCDAFVHFGATSVRLFADQYPGLAKRPTTIIPLGMTSVLPNEISAGEARESLKLPADAFVCLSMGQLRHMDELRLLLQGFKHLQARPKRLLIAGRFGVHPKRSVRLAARARVVLTPGVHLYAGYQRDEEVQRFVNACDCVVVPRIQSLNSAGTSLAFTFGKVVVGPNVGVMGESLKELGNPAFEPADARSLGRALDQARKLAADGGGEVNLRYAEAHLNNQRIADLYQRFFEEVAASRSSSAY